MKSWQYGKEACVHLYFSLYIYKHKLGPTESFTESTSTSITSSGAFGENLDKLTMTNFLAGNLQPSDQHLQICLKIH